MRSRSFITMDIPRPVPSICLFFVSSRRSKETKSLSLSSSRMPIPVSITATNSSVSLPSVRPLLTDSVIEPLSVYFTAFVSRFMITCETRTSSPYKRLGNVSSISSVKSSPLAVALVSTDITKPLTICAVSYSASTSSIFPSSIFEKSRILFISVSKVLDAVPILSAYSRIFGSFVSWRIISFMPRTALIGVRISWDICAKNWLLALSARIALSAASFSLFSYSICFKVEMWYCIIAMEFNRTPQRYSTGKRFINVSEYLPCM